MGDIRTCEMCGRRFEAHAVNAKYCSEPCRKKAIRIRQKSWYKKNKSRNKSIEQSRAERLEREKRRRLKASVRIAVEMGLRKPDKE